MHSWDRMSKNSKNNIGISLNGLVIRKGVENVCRVFYVLVKVQTIFYGCLLVRFELVIIFIKPRAIEIVKRKSQKRMLRKY